MNNKLFDFDLILISYMQLLSNYISNYFSNYFSNYVTLIYRTCFFAEFWFFSWIFLLEAILAINHKPEKYEPFSFALKPQLKNMISNSSFRVLKIDSHLMHFFVIFMEINTDFSEILATGTGNFSFQRAYIKNLLQTSLLILSEFKR